MVCDEEVISTDTSSKHCISAAPAHCDIKPKRQDVKKLGKASVRKVKSVCLSSFELDGLEAVVTWLEGLPLGKRNVPKDILEPDDLLRDVRVSRILLLVLFRASFPIFYLTHRLANYQ